MTPFAIDPLTAAVFACGFLLAVMLVRTVRARQSTNSRRPVTPARSWMPAAVALVLLVALWLWLA